MFLLSSGSSSQESGSHDHESFGLKPMNCPGHCLIFSSSFYSYKDLPIRLADFSPLHRNEISGALSGLTRVRKFQQDDAHIFCLPSQVFFSFLFLSLLFLKKLFFCSWSQLLFF